MDRNVQRRMLLAMDSISDGSRLREYGLRLRANYPSQEQEISRTLDCYETSHQADQCLQRVIGGGAGDSLTTTQLSPDVRFFARGIASLGEQALRERWSMQQFVSRVYSEQLSFSQRLTAEERDSLNDLAAFYARQLPDMLLQETRERLSRIGDWRSRLEAYDRRPVTPTMAPVEPLCSASVEWERHYLQVNGLSYAVPIFTPRSRGLPWAFYESALLAEFEKWKVFLTPADFERLLQPGQGRPALVIYIGGHFPGSEEIFHQCGFRTDDRSGEFLSRGNYIMSTVPFRSGNDAETEVLRHEIGHAVYYNLLTSDQRETIKRFFEATKAFTERNLDYIPNSQYVDPRYTGGRRGYAMTSEEEFFAEMVSEHTTSRLNQESYGTGPFDVRRTIMNRFFGSDHIHPEVFSEEAVEAAFRAGHVPFEYPAHGYFDLMPNFVFNSSRGWGAELYLGGRGVSPNHVLTYGGGLYVQPGFQSGGSLGIGAEGNFGVMPASWLGLDALVRIGLRPDFSNSQVTGVAGGGLRLRIRPSSLFEFQGFLIPQVDMATGRGSYDLGGGFGFNF